MKPTIRYNPNYAFLWHNIEKSCVRRVVLEGGTRSGKTRSVLDFIIAHCRKYEGAGIEIAIVRKTLAALKLTALKDFVEILKKYKIYSESIHNKTDNIFNIFGNKVQFFGADNDDKLRGFSCNILYINEGLELDLEEYRQLKMRTTGKIIIDYNPSETEHYMYDEFDIDDSAVLLKTTYLDNPFLPPLQVAEIELFKTTDKDYWRIFGEGKRGQMRNLVFPEWRIVQNIPTDGKKYGMGLDFGFTNDPSALVQCCIQNGEIWLDELLFERGLTNPDLSKAFKDLGLSKTATIHADSAEPKSIQELKNLGWNVTPAIKGNDSVRHSINSIKQYKINVTSRSLNIIKELRSYKWKERNGHQINEPIDRFNHGIDAFRYWAMGNLNQIRSGFTISQGT
ncbi:MAG: PBSX family phage terminase large subunit [Saprospiraceae bacterium]|nr:PBSX family phage terminase large subunit [Saprospiraceae bacterium]